MTDLHTRPSTDLDTHPMTTTPARSPVTPDPPPWDRTTVLSQQWCELAYFHWPYDPAVVQATLPPGLTVDTFDGKAWVGLIPFEMRNVRLGPIPAPKPLANFIEINVRTYVVDRHGRRAVWFYSLDVPRLPIVAVARTVFSLPYQWADASHEVNGDRHRYRMTRRHRPGRGHGRNRSDAPVADIDFTVGPAIKPHEVTELDHFLSARWALITRRGDRLLHGRVDHPRWPLHRVEQATVNQNVIEAAGLPTPVGSPRALYSPGVDVELAWLRAVDEPEEGR
jgi:uncharacterized protein YqjF (DUF2071 family)